jgi:pimeloyl-ACP methyl ester carboxylesterase
MHSGQKFEQMPTVGRTFFRQCLRGIGVLGLLVIALACAGALCQAIGNWRDGQRFPNTGKLVHAGATKLNIICIGAKMPGKPAVILESAGGSPARVWAKVQPEIAKFSRVCSYDRAGLGWSEAATTPRTREQEAEELKALLTAAGENGPFVMAGVSQGGFTVQAYTHKYPDDVAAVVLVDASHPDTDKRTLEVLSKVEAEKYRAFNAALRSDWVKFANIWANRLGVSRLLTPAKDELESELNFLSWQTKSMNTFFEESKLYDKGAEKIRTIGNLGSRPLIVLTAGKEDDLYESPADAAATRELWVNELQKSMAGLSTRGKQIIVPDSGHMIPIERPDAVVSAIREVWEQTGP